MARMSIDDMLGRDPRITVLSTLVGWSRRETAGCLILDVWPICYDQRTHIISERIIDAAAGHTGFARAMIESELASPDRSGKIRIRGARERIEYLDRKRASGRQGGLKSGESRSKSPKQTRSECEANAKQTSSTGGSTPQAPWNPSVPDPASASAPDLDPSLKNSAPPSAGGTQPGFAEFESKISDNLGAVGLQRARGKRRKPSDLTASEVASVRVVLDKLGEQNGITYTGTQEHARLITTHLRNGITEHDLRIVVGYCALELGWKDDEQMRKYLRPETLFGPKTISKYLDPARAWFAKLPPDEPKPDPEAEPEWMGGAA